ncbi:hypothetical protein EDB80DRAFT_345790 [Ilyonectria destructans]|nr:hypothetical protein EDB80DRAFT_345790 [Ilyonectria destructans]
MSKPEKSRDSLRVRNSRIKKNPRQQKQKPNYPAWYIRLVALTLTGEIDVEQDDFDEDISELEEDPDDGSAEEVECGCDGDDPECACLAEDQESERSHDDSDADDYYLLKEQREDRKKELFRLKKHEGKEKAMLREYDRTKEDEVRAAYQSLKDNSSVRQEIPVESLATEFFELFSTDLIDYCYYSMRGTMRFDMEYPTKRGGEYVDEKPEDWDGILDCQIYIDSDVVCQLKLRAPKYASLKPITLKSKGGVYEVSVIFMGNGYMKLTVSREFVFKGSRRPIPHEAPKFFEFFGIIRDEERLARNGWPQKRSVRGNSLRHRVRLSSRCHIPWGRGIGQGGHDKDAGRSHNFLAELVFGVATERSERVPNNVGGGLLVFSDLISENTVM